MAHFVNSTASAAELSQSLPSAGLLSQTVRAVLLTSVAMFLRNCILLAHFGRAAVRFAFLPLLSMTLVASYFAFRHREADADRQELELAPCIASLSAQGDSLRSQAHAVRGRLALHRR